MYIRLLKSLFTSILLISCQQSFAQSLDLLDLEDLLSENGSGLEKILDDNKIEEINENLISKSPKTPSSIDQNISGIGVSQNLNSMRAPSISNRYYKALTGQDLNAYGKNEFNNTIDDGLIFFNTVGKNYQLAPGDTIQVTITGSFASDEDYQVLNDGTISPLNMYPLVVDGLNIDQVNKLILDKIRFDDASAEVFVRLNSARLLTVQISGNVNFPKTIAVPAYTALSRVIAHTGGVSESGSLRNISLSQVGSETQSVDFYDFLQSPSPKNDPLIKNGARIFVPNKGPTIAALGFLNRPGIYELPTGKSEITIKELLNITGTTLFPAGATLKVLYFDSNGQIATRLAAKDDLINAGEALQVDFIETRDLNISKVYGAVIKNYEIKTNKPLSIKEVLKGGAVLNANAHYQFALIDGVEVTAIDLNDALDDENIILPAGADLLIFTKKEYLSLVAENPNKSLSPLMAKLVKVKNLAEIYLDGMRIAYVPVSSDDNTIKESLRNFYIPSPKTVFDIALIENKLQVEAVDLKAELSKYGRRSLANGDRLFIFEDKFYDDLLLNILLKRTSKLQASTSTSTLNAESVEVIMLQQQIQIEENEYLEALSYSQRILQQANLVNIKLDGELFTYLPFIKGMSSSYALEKLRNRLPKLVSEFAIVQNVNLGKTPQAKNLNDTFEIKQGEEINFISSENYRLVIKNYENEIETNSLSELETSSVLSELETSNLLSELKSSDAVKVYYDGKLVLLLPPNYKPSELKLFEQYSKSSDLYKLYVGLNTENLKNGTWDLITFGTEDFFSSTNKLILGPSNVVSLFSNSFIRNEFINDNVNVNGVNFNINAELNFQDEIIQIPNASVPINNLNDIKTNQDKLINPKNKLLNSHIEIMRNSLRTISGSVQFPGSYPVAKKIGLTNFLSTAGLIEHTSKSNIIITEAIFEKGRLIKSSPKTIKFSNANINKVALSGLYYLEVPLAINDAITGVIELKGEILIPGKYSFTRSETLQDIISRAGGLSDVAFPLGAELHRVSAKVLERETNDILADQLEASILNLAQSSLEGAGDQVKVVLGYATQLRNQPTTGRMALNVLEDNPSNPIFLEDGDKLTIPKRPSHVSIVGSVQRSTIATYVNGNNFNDYLEVAGGLTKVADSRKAYLLLPNGESRQLNKSTVIPVGSVIIVPPKLDRLSILGGTDIVSKVLSNISNSFLSIQNVD
jgi:protein involved in polysaccharide export with SLBB domain